MIFKCRVDLLKEINKYYYFNNYLSASIHSCYKETRMFKKAVLRLVINICESNPTYKAGYIIHQVLENLFIDDWLERAGVYKTIKYVILPVLLKNHKTMKRQKQLRLTFLADELDKHNRPCARRALVVRTSKRTSCERL